MILFNGYSQSNYIAGRVRVDAQKCAGCRACTIICPATVLEMDDNRHSRMKIDADCISCGACMAVCSSDAIRITTFYQVPDGAFATCGRLQATGRAAFPRNFKETVHRNKKGR